MKAVRIKKRQRTPEGVQNSWLELSRVREIRDGRKEMGVWQGLCLTHSVDRVLGEGQTRMRMKREDEGQAA